MGYSKSVKAWGLALCAVLLLSASTAANASAADWRLSESEILSAVPTTGSGTLELTDEAGFLGTEVTVKCAVATTGTAGPGPADTTSTVSFGSCATVKGICGSPAVAPVDTPWKTELIPTGGVVRDKIVADGKGPPRYEVDCTVLGVREPDTCTSERGQPLVTTGVSPVPVVFDAGSGTADCTLGGAGKGHVRGTVSVKSSAGTLVVH